jgi:hypothetical protein
MALQMLLCGECYENVYTKAYKLNVVKHLERRIVYTPLSINVIVTLATQQHLECQCKVLFETPCIITGSHIEP